MAPWLLNLLQQFGREMITGTPDVVNAVKREYRAAKDPYLDKRTYWLRRGGAAESDADEHRIFDSMTADQRARLAELQASGACPAFENTKPKHRRPWTGAFALLVRPPDK